MTITLTPKIERVLTARAEQQGTTPELLVLNDLSGLYAQADATRASVQSGDQLAASFRQWADNHRRTEPVIPLDAMSREHLYEERS